MLRPRPSASRSCRRCLTKEHLVLVARPSAHTYAAAVLCRTALASTQLQPLPPQISTPFWAEHKFLLRRGGRPSALRLSCQAAEQHALPSPITPRHCLSPCTFSQLRRPNPAPPPPHGPLFALQFSALSALSCPSSISFRNQRSRLLQQTITPFSFRTQSPALKRTAIPERRSSTGSCMHPCKAKVTAWPEMSPRLHLAAMTRGECSKGVCVAAAFERCASAADVMSTAARFTASPPVPWSAPFLLSSQSVKGVPRGPHKRSCRLSTASARSSSLPHPASRPC